MGKEVILRILPRKFSNDVERRAQVSTFFFSLVNYRRIYSIHFEILHFAEDVLFYPKNEIFSLEVIESRPRNFISN